MDINLQHMKVRLVTAALCIPVFFLSFSSAGSYADEPVYTVRESSPANSKTKSSGKLNAPPYLTRDLFSSGYLKHKSRGIPRETGKGLKLKATIIDGRNPLAIIGDEVLGIGEFLNGLEVTDIKNNEVILSKGENKYRLRMDGE